MATNQHVRSFLDYYCAFPDPGYAVMLSGSWGSGKTWFIKKYMEADPENADKFLYVSLYGVRSGADIEAQLFARLHPILASKGVKVAKTVLSGFAQLALKMDFNSDGKEDATLTAKLPSADLLKSLSVDRDRILVVDDLERCSMPVSDVLGFVNQFVEHGGVHAILLANLDEVDKNNDNYKRINEKLIGRTLAIESDIDAALVQFLSDMPSLAPRQIAQKSTELIKQVYRASKSQNLRLVRHGLVEFDRLCYEIDASAMKSEPLMENFLGIFLAHFIEVKSGNLPVEKIPCFREGIGNYLRFRENKAEDTDEVYFDLRTKYTALNLHDDTVGEEIWTHFFSTGAIPAEALNNGLLHSRYFKSATQPNWVKLWHGRDLEDAEFEKVLEAIDNEWSSTAYDNVGVVSHVTGSLIRYAKAGIYKKSEAEILAVGKAHVDRLLKEGKIDIPMPNQMTPVFQRDSFAGLGFMSLEEPSFQEYLRYLDAQVESEKLARLPRYAEELLGLLKTDPSGFLRRLMLNNEPDNFFYRTPILHLVDVEVLVKVLMEIPPESRRTFAFALKGRYEFDQYNGILLAELDWLRMLKDRLLVEAKVRRGKVSSTLLESIIDSYVVVAIQKLEDKLSKVTPPPRARAAPSSTRE